ncbi:MAG: cyclic pyranopterin monophosphate synthase MoaC [Planctomycetes bacterium]|nr:cyclic pyranopterin monophosphate synthase MoaC [Planctomycetota bacterium]
MPDKLSHLDDRGRVQMVDVSAKMPMRRTAVAEGFLHAAESTLELLEVGELPKGEALAAARIAGIQAAKRCGELIPLCHPLSLDDVRVSFERVDLTRLRIETQVTTTARTGVEMEALLAVSVAALTLYDMAKAVDKNMAIEGVHLVSKTKEEAT